MKIEKTLEEISSKFFEKFMLWENAPKEEQVIGDEGDYILKPDIDPMDIHSFIEEEFRNLFEKIEEEFDSAIYRFGNKVLDKVIEKDE